MKRKAFTLIELLLSLSLIVLATALIGSLMQIYSHNFATRGDDIRREQLARALLTKIADDIRSVVMPQEYDPSVLEQLMGASGASGGAAGTSADETSTASSSSSLASSQSASGSSSGDATSDSASGDLANTVSTSLPPGIYGDQYSLKLDVSRIPRPDEYIVPQASLADHYLLDVPGDMKTVTYYLQSPTNMGVEDSLAQFSDPSQDAGVAGGLIRRQLDRAVTAYAEEMGQTQQLQRTGDLLAPEVVALEFSYFDGEEWLTEWDSSTQSLPWLVEITLAMQTAGASENTQLAPGGSIGMMSYADRQAYGLKVYQLVVAIPGAQLRAADASTADQAAGMESLGL